MTLKFRSPLILFLVASFLLLGIVEVSAHSLSIALRSVPLIGWPFPLSTLPIDERMPAVAYNNTDQEFLVVWENDRPSATNDIYAQRVSQDGRLLSWFYVADGTDPDVAYNPTQNDYLVVYSTYDVSTMDWDIGAMRVDYTGPQGSEFLVYASAADDLNPRLDYNTHAAHDSYLVVFNQISTSPSLEVNVRGQMITGVEGAGAGGSNKLTTENDIAVSATGEKNFNPDVAYNLNHNEFLVVWVNDATAGADPDALDIHGRRMTAAGVLLPTNVIDSSAKVQEFPAVAAYWLNAATPYLVVFNDHWNSPEGDVRGYLCDFEGVPNTIVYIATQSAQLESSPAIASSEGLGGYTVTWNEYDSGANDWDVFGRRVANDGVLGESFSIGELLAPAGCGGTNPAVAGGSPTALVAWNATCFTTSIDIGGRLLGYQLSLPLIAR